MEEIVVLMSTYNGSNYLEKQLESIKNQKGVKIKLVVRDDGSKDNTIEILEKWSEAIDLDIIKGENLGSSKSFLELLKNSPNANYYAFADQDDYWLNNKLITAIEKLKKYSNEAPSLYFSEMTLVNQDLEKIKTEKWHRYIDFPRSLIHNPASGCTMVFNHKTKEIINENKSDVFMHDSFIFKVINALGGNIHFDTNSYILYRQHGNNVVGGSQPLRKKMKKRFSTIKNKPRYREKESTIILQNYKDNIKENNIKYLDYLANYRSTIKYRFYLLFSRKFIFNKLSENIYFRISVILGRL